MLSDDQPPLVSTRKKHVTTSTATIHRSLSDPQLRRDPMARALEVERTFTQNGINLFRSKASSNFYKSFSPRSELLQTHWTIQALSAIQAEIAKHESKDYGTSITGVRCSVRDSEGAFRWLLLPKQAAKLVSIYKQAQAYEITWSEARAQTRDILYKNFRLTPLGGRSRFTQDVYNRCFVIYQEKFETRSYPFANVVTNEPVNIKQLLQTVIAQLNETQSSNWKTALSEYTNLCTLLKLEEFPQSDATRIAALDSVMLELDRIRHSIRFGQRNGSRLYRHINTVMLTIAYGKDASDYNPINFENDISDYLEIAKARMTPNHLRYRSMLVEGSQKDYSIDDTSPEAGDAPLMTLKNEIERNEFHPGLMGYLHPQSPHNTIEIPDSNNGETQALRR